MTTIAVSGHRGLQPQTAQLVDAAIRVELGRYADSDDLTGLSCLADGADQIFATAVLDAGGELEVYIPAEQYRAGLPSDCWPSYDALFSRASAIHALERIESTPQAHLAASAAMLEHADLLFAVWDQEPARGYGGTADIVAFARAHDVPVTVIWPAGASRD